MTTSHRSLPTRLIRILRATSLSMMVMLPGMPLLAAEPVSSETLEGTLFPDTLIIISIDGAGHDYLERHHAPTLSALQATGVRVDHLQPVFPSKTFTNHYSLMTGLYPRNHGIINNIIYDPEFDAVFSPGNVPEVQNNRWWGGEPIWVTAEKQGMIAGTVFFPGSEAPIQGIRPTYWFTYNESMDQTQRVDTVLSWLDKPAAERPQMMTLYFSTVDLAGHDYGPDSVQVAQAMTDADQSIAYLLSELDARRILDKVNLLIVSDHGMTNVDLDNHVIIDEAFDTSLAARMIVTGELVSIFPKQGQTQNIVQQLQANLPPQVSTYTDETIPQRFNYTGNPRIAPINVLADSGWRLLTRVAYDRLSARDDFNRIRGGHGYDHEHPDMQGLLIAHGPAFNKSSRIERLSMIDLYNVMTAVLDLSPAANDGDPAVLPLLLKPDIVDRAQNRTQSKSQTQTQTR
jgi:predicted AlkP superfamily pyrophosphatase or phosphodiesterase